MTETKLIYKYMPINEYLYSLLINNEFYLAHPSEFNDPFDSRYISKLQGTEQDWKTFLKKRYQININEVSKEYFEKECNDFIEKSWKLLKQLDKNQNNEYYIAIPYSSQKKHLSKEIKIFYKYLKDKNSPIDQFNTSDNLHTYKDLITILKPYMKGYAPGIGITSFSKTNDNTLMWAHYAQKHEGVCLGFKYEDNSQYGTTLAKSRIQPVSYDPIDKKTHINFVLDYDNFEKTKIPFFTKTSEWHYEKEWRIVRENEKFISFEETELQEIIFGLNCTPKIKKTIIKYILNHPKLKNHVVFFQSKYKKNEYGIKIHKIDKPEELIAQTIKNPYHKNKVP